MLMTNQLISKIFLKTIKDSQNFNLYSCFQHAKTL